MSSDLDKTHIISQLQNLRHFSGEPNQFWVQYIELLNQLLDATHTCLFLHDEQVNQWKNIYNSTTNQTIDISPTEISTLAALANGAMNNHFCIDDNNHFCIDDNNRFLLCAYPTFDESADRCMIGVIIPNKTKSDFAFVSLTFNLVADIPNSYLQQLKLRQSNASNEIAYDVLKLLTVLQQSKKFSETVLSLCNELATQHKYKQVSLGWVENGYVCIKAISHVTKFKTKMALTRQLELTMEEAIDQETEINWPCDSNGLIHRNHNELGQMVQCLNIHTLPLKFDNQIFGALCVESIHETSIDELNRLRIFCDQFTEKLTIQKHNDAWLGRRMIDYSRKKLSRFFGIEHTLIKLLAVFTCLTLIVLAFIKVPYRIEAPFIIKTENLQYITAPYDGYIEASDAKAGNHITQNQLLVTLNTQALYLKRASILADLSRYNSQYENERAKGALADMKIAASLKEQTKVRLEEIQYYLNQANITSPIDGIVVDGDLSSLSGSAIKKGELLLKIGTLEKLYLEIELDEHFIHEVSNKLEGEVAFQSQPNLQFPFSLTQVHPAAATKEGKSIFVLEGEFKGKNEHWWRPGMTGLAKINIEERSLIWILTHRTTAFFYLWLWW